MGFRVRWYDGILLLLVLAALGWTAFSGLGWGSSQGSDENSLYVAGYDLHHGISPYDSEPLKDQWPQILHKTFIPGMFFAYPPTFLPYAWALAGVPPRAALLLFNLVNMAALLAVLGAIALLLVHFRPGTSVTEILVGFILALVPNAVRLTLAYGQTSLIVVAALLWSLYFLIRGRNWPAVFLLVFIASVKPQLGLVPGAAVLILFSRPRWWAAAALLLSAWVGFILVAFGTDQLSGFLAALPGYDSSGFNSVQRMTGLPTLVSLVRGVLPAEMALEIAGLAVALALAYRLRAPASRVMDTTDRLEVDLGLVVTILILNEALSPMHYYDHVFLMGLLAFCVILPRVPGVILGVWLLLAARPEVLFPITGYKDVPAVAMTLSLMVSALATVWFLLRQPRNSKNRIRTAD